MICKHCHRFKPRKAWKPHQKLCVPSKEDLEHYSISKSGGSRSQKK